MSDKVEKVVELINKMNYDELVAVIDAVKLRRQFISRNNIRSITTGDMVQFNSGSRGIITGKVIKVNQKNVKIEQKSSGGLVTKWNVPAALVKKIEQKVV